MKISKIRLLCTFSLSLASVTFLHANDHITNIGSILINESMLLIEQTKITQNTIDTQQALNLQLQALPPHEVIRAEINLFKKYAETYPAAFPVSNICSLKEMEKLGVLRGTESDSSHSLSNLFHNKTHAGHLYTSYLIATPTNDVSILQKRQDIIDYLLCNPDVLYELEEQLDALKEAEPYLISLCKELSPVEKRTLNSPYFSSELTSSANHSPALLTLYYGIQNLGNLYNLIPHEIPNLAIGLLVTGFIVNPDGGLKGLFKKNALDWRKGLRESLPNLKTGIVEGTKMVALQHYPFLYSLHKEDLPNNTFLLVRKQKGFAFSGGDLFYELTKNLMNDGYLATFIGKGILGDEIMSKNLFTPYPATITEKLCTYPAAALVPIFSCVKNDYDNYTRVKNFKKNAKTFSGILQHFQTKLWSTATLIRTHTSMQELVQNTPLQEILETCSIQDSQLKNLLQNLNTNPAYNQRQYQIKNTGTILANNYEIDRYKEQLLELIRPVAIVDSYIAVARYIQTLQNKNLPISRAIFIEAQAPHCSMHKYWNPLVSTANVVTNTTIFSNDGMRNMLLTGPNGSGKSTNSKAIIYNILLAQTFGFGCAENMQLTPYSKIRVAFNEQEDISSNQSLFMAEQRKIETLCNEIRYMNQSEKTFLLFDEAIKGTIEEVVGDIMLDTCLLIAQQPQVNAIIITHAEKPTEAESLTNGIIKNYFVQVDEQETFVRTFKLQRGKAAWWFNNPETRKRFVAFLAKK